MPLTFAVILVIFSGVAWGVGRMENVIIEFYAQNELEAPTVLTELLETKLVHIDKGFGPIRIKRRAASKRYPVMPDTFVVRGRAAAEDIAAISALPFVVKVWLDSPIDHFRCGCNPT